MEISASAAAVASAPPPKLLLRPLAASAPTPANTPPSSSSATIRRGSPPSSSASTATVRRRARTRPRTGRSKQAPDGGGFLSGDDGSSLGGPSGGGGWNWNHGSGSGSGSDWEPDVPAPRRSAAEAALGFVYELMCLLALSNCTQFAVRRLAGLLAAHVAALRFVPTVC